jgi:predicted transcriptional regulator
LIRVKPSLDTIEDTEIYNELRKFKLDIEPFNLSHELIKKILDILKKKGFISKDETKE